MRRFRRENEQHIREMFEQKAGITVTIPKRRTGAKAALALGLAAVLSCTAVFAAEMFSSLNGDDLSLNAVYEGDGVVTVRVENRSDKPLVFQKKLKLFRWIGQEELEAREQPAIEGERIAPHSDGTLTIDLSGAYDLDRLEQPLEPGDSYYLVLTNGDFLFGQDWMCTVPFAESIPREPEPLPESIAAPAPGKLGEVEESLRFYFEDFPTDIDQRRELDEQYEAAVKKLLDGLDAEVVPTSGAMEILVADPESGVVLDPTVPLDEQGLLIGEHLRSADWDYKLLATEEEKALILSASIPMKQYPDAGGSLPLFYLFAYEKADLTGEPYLFVRGRLLPLSAAGEYLVFEDGEYLCYDFSPLFYTELAEQVERFAAWHPELRWDEEVRQRVENIHRYYRENLERLVCRRGG